MSDLTGILINTVDGPTQATEADLRASGWLPASQVEAALAVADEWAGIVRRDILEHASPHYLRAALAEFDNEKAVVMEALGSARQGGASG
jgi:hypothetical protein